METTQLATPAKLSGTGRELILAAAWGSQTFPGHFCPLFGLTVHRALKFANSRICCPSSTSQCGISDCAARFESQIDGQVRNFRLAAEVGFRNDLPTYAIPAKRDCQKSSLRARANPRAEGRDAHLSTTRSTRSPKAAAIPVLERCKEVARAAVLRAKKYIILQAPKRHVR